MKAETIQVKFTRELWNYLKGQGYSHILSIGAVHTEDSNEQYAEDYRLVALLPDDPRLQYEETDHIILPIESDDALEMANGVDPIRFLIEIPAEQYEQYLKRD